MEEQLKTPMLDRLSKASAFSQPLGDFIDWLHADQKIFFMRPAHMHGGDAGVQFTEVDECRDLEDCRAYRDIMVNVRTPITELLARYFEIDLKQVDQEREAILDHLRKRRT